MINIICLLISWPLALSHAHSLVVKVEALRKQLALCHWRLEFSAPIDLKNSQFVLYKPLSKPEAVAALASSPSPRSVTLVLPQGCEQTMQLRLNILSIDGHRQRSQVELKAP